MDEGEVMEGIKRLRKSPLERGIVNHIVASVTTIGGAIFRLRFISVRGAPDCVVFLPGGKIYLVELKRPKGGKLSKLQGYIHGILAKLGTTVHVLHTKDLVDMWIEIVRP